MAGATSQSICCSRPPSCTRVGSKCSADESGLVDDVIAGPLSFTMAASPVDGMARCSRGIRCSRGESLPKDGIVKGGLGTFEGPGAGAALQDREEPACDERIRHGMSLATHLRHGSPPWHRTLFSAQGRHATDALGPTPLDERACFDVVLSSRCPRK